MATVTLTLATGEQWEQAWWTTEVARQVRELEARAANPEYRWMAGYIGVVRDRMLAGARRSGVAL